MTGSVGLVITGWQKVVRIRQSSWLARKTGKMFRRLDNGSGIFKKKLLTGIGQ